MASYECVGCSGRRLAHVCKHEPAGELLDHSVKWWLGSSPLLWGGRLWPVKICLATGGSYVPSVRRGVVGCLPAAPRIFPASWFEWSCRCSCSRGALVIGAWASRPLGLVHQSSA